MAVNMSFVGAIVSFLLQSGLQLNGYSNPIIGNALLVFAGIFVLYGIWGAINQWRQSKNKPAFQFSWADLGRILSAVSAVFLGAVIGVYCDHRFSLFPEPPKTIIVSAPPPPPSTNIPAKLIANIMPDFPSEVAVLAARQLLLRELISAGKKSREVVETIGPKVRDALKPVQPSQNTFINRGAWMAQQYQSDAFYASIHKIQEVNVRAYSNRPLDLQTVPELAIPTMVAPDEGAFVATDDNTNKNKYDYRRIHFLIGNILKQVDSLINDMEAESNYIVQKLQKSAEGKPFVIGGP